MRWLDEIIRTALGVAVLALGMLLLVLEHCHGSEAEAEPPAPAFFLIIENGGTVTDHDAALQTISFTLGEVVKLRRRRDTRDTAIHLILTANPTEVTWSGTPQQLFEQGHAVMEMITFRDTCSDLLLAWDQVHLTTRITRPGAVRLIGIGPMIHAGFPCHDGETTISLPQQPPADLQLANMAARADFLRLLNVHADQDEVYLNHLDQAGLLDRVSEGTLDFDLLDRARTRASLGQILGER